MNYKSIVAIAFMAISLSVYSQDKKVGINTDKPTEALDVNGDLKVRKIKKIGSSHSLVANDEGVWGYYTDFVLHDIESHIATDPLDIKVDEGVKINDRSLGLATTLTIPANTDAKVIIEYSVPVGIVVDENEDTDNLTANFFDYAGVRFMKKEEGKTEEAFGGSRKYTVDDWVDKDYGTVVTVTNKYVGKFDKEPKDRVITYSLNAYVEHWQDVKRHYRFNMYSSTPGDNRNWGKGIITQKVYFR